jgi:hypothetical protein
VDYVKPWYYWNHWDYYWNYYYWDYYWDYYCGCWGYDYQPLYYWYYPSTIYYNFYGHCYYYYQVVYVKVYDLGHQFFPWFSDSDKQTATATKKSTA